jgi:hypothetical protein
MELTQGSGMRGRTFDPSPPVLGGRLTALGEFSYRASPTGTVHEITFREKINLSKRKISISLRFFTAKFLNM